MSSREQSSNSARQQKASARLDPQSVSPASPADISGEGNETLSNPQLKGPPRRPVVESPPKPPEDTSIHLASSPSMVASTSDDELPETLGQQPIPLPSEPMQYRAIGLIKGKYQPSEEQFNRGLLITDDQTELDAVLLGQVMSLVKKYLDLEQTYLWVVYPRTREKEETLHMQIVGVWSAEGFGPMAEVTQGNDPSEQPSQLAAPLKDGYFSVRGEIVFQSPEQNYLLVKIQQSPRKSSDRPKAFKLKLLGILTDKTLGYFWDLQVQRQGSELAIVKGQRVALVPPKRRSKKEQRSHRQPSKPKHTGHESKPYAKPRMVGKPIKRRSSSES